MQNVILSPDEVPVLGFPGTAGGGVEKGRAGSDGGEAGIHADQTRTRGRLLIVDLSSHCLATSL